MYLLAGFRSSLHALQGSMWVKTKDGVHFNFLSGPHIFSWMGSYFAESTSTDIPRMVLALMLSLSRISCSGSHRVVGLRFWRAFGRVWLWSSPASVLEVLGWGDVGWERSLGRSSPVPQQYCRSNQLFLECDAAKRASTAFAIAPLIDQQAIVGR